MNNLKIIANGIYFPTKQVKNEELENKLNLEKGYIEKRTGIKNRYYAVEEKIEDMALKATKNLFEKEKMNPKEKMNQKETNENETIKRDIDKEQKTKDIDLIITATTSTDILMPGISNYIQKNLNLKPCICLDILAGCSGYINSFDIAKMYIDSGNVKRALIVGVDRLSQVIDKEDIGTAVVLSDGAGVTLIEKDEETNKQKLYISNIQADGDNNDILTYKYGKKIYMNGKEVYKYAVTKTVQNIKELLNKANLNLEDIKYIVPHQSNLKIMKAIASRLHIKTEKMYTDIETRGNTFCASIPIALHDMQEKGMLKPGDKIILLGYGGGLNTGSILLEI